MQKSFILTTLFFLSLNVISAQESGVVKGVIQDSLGNTVSNASVVIKHTIKGTIITYTFSDSDGSFSLKATGNFEEYSLEVSSLGFASYTSPLNKIKGLIAIKLIPSKTELETVIINTKKRVKISKDTITFRTKHFTDGTETVAEDLLKKIPGISVSEDGTIKIGNKEVEKVMVEGDDFFEKGYKTLTKNLPAAPIEEVELLQRYSNNKLLKGIEESDKVALNLKLNEDAKRQWFGTIDLGYGIASENRYDARTNFLNFGKKNKYYFFTNLNNIGYDATGDISNLIRSSRFGEPGSIGDNQNVNQLVQLSNTVPYFKESRFKFNNAELLSLNAIFNPTDVLKIKTVGFANWDEVSFFRNSADTFIANDTNFTNTENLTLNSDYITLFGKIELSYDLTKNQNITTIAKYSNTDEDKNSSIIFNNTPLIQGLNSETKRFDQKISYSNKFTKTAAFLITARYINEDAPQLFNVNQNNFTSLFENSTPSSTIQQSSSFNYSFLGVEAHLLDRKKSGNLFELKIGNTYRDDTLISSFNLNNAQNLEDFSNNFEYAVNDIYASSKYLFKLSSKWSVTGDISIHYLNNRIENNSLTNEETTFFINPSITTAIEFNDKNQLNAHYSLTRRNAQINELYPNFALSGFRSFRSGTGDFNQLDAANASLSYTLGNWTDNFFATAFITYSNSFDFFSTNSIINQDFTLNEQALFNDSERWTALLTFDRYFKFISSNLKGTFSTSTNDFSNIVNTVARDITSRSNSIGFEMRSGFKGIFNYHIGNTWRTSTIESEGLESNFNNTISFVDLSFLISNNFNIKLQGERYYFGNLQGVNSYYFADLESQYTLKKNKIILSLSGKNLFNTELFREFSINDLGTSTTEYRLLPRYILGKLTYRF